MKINIRLVRVRIYSAFFLFFLFFFYSVYVCFWRNWLQTFGKNSTAP